MSRITYDVNGVHNILSSVDVSHNQMNFTRPIFEILLLLLLLLLLFTELPVFCQPQ